jgi:molybdopterin-guanine dinucleotide biosynthesis protein A
MSVIGVVLAGGRSSRFGRDKALLKIDGETLLRRTVATLKSVTPDVLVIGPSERTEQVEGVQVVQDEIPGIGPLGGIYTALRTRPDCSALVVAVDMPFLSAALLGYLVQLSEQADVVLPVVGGITQQTHTVYGPECLRHIESQIATGDYKVDRFFPKVAVRRVDEAELAAFDPRLQSFRNANTPELWQAALIELQDAGSTGPEEMRAK